MSLKCPQCKQRTLEIVAQGPLRPDPKHPGDRSYDERTVTERCCTCGFERQTIELPNLLADLFGRQP